MSTGDSYMYVHTEMHTVNYTLMYLIVTTIHASITFHVYISKGGKVKTMHSSIFNTTMMINLCMHSSSTSAV